MNSIAAIRDADDVQFRRERIAVPEADLERIRATLDRGVDHWVAAVVVDDAERVVLVQNQWSDGWIAPGGSVEPGEDSVTAAEREVREETGIEATVREPVAVVEEILECNGTAAWGHRIVYAAAAESAELAENPGLDGEGIEAVDWFAELPERTEYRGLVERGRERRSR